MATRLLPLTPRQQQVLRLVARAQTNKEIAANLKISRADRQKAYGNHPAETQAKKSNSGGPVRHRNTKP